MFKSHLCLWKFCNKHFSTPGELYYHVYSEHTNELACRWQGCPYKCGRRAQILSHIIVHVHFFPFGCSQCDKKFKRKNDCKKHESAMHDIGDLKLNINEMKDTIFKKTSLEYILN